MDEMAEANKRDMQFDSELRDLRERLEKLYDRYSERNQSKKAFVISDAMDVVDEERAAIVRRWD